jgi:hypothetical protein
MRNIAELTVLLRERVALPDHFKLVTEEFREGWDVVRSGDVNWLDKKIRRCGWHFIRSAEGSSKSGIGQTPQEAIASALKSTLRCVSGRFNAAEVGHIKLNEYRWFVSPRSEYIRIRCRRAQFFLCPISPHFWGCSLWQVLSSRPIRLCPKLSDRTPLPQPVPGELFSSVMVAASLKQ